MYYNLQLIVHREEKARQEPEAGTERTTGERCLLAYTLSAFLYNPGAPAQGGISHTGLGHNASAINQENAHKLAYETT